MTSPLVMVDVEVATFVVRVIEVEAGTEKHLQAEESSGPGL